VFELAGLIAGEDYDQLFGLGNSSITLDGILDIDLLELPHPTNPNLANEVFWPEIGSVFELIVADVIFGTFAELDLPSLGSDRFFALQYDINEGSRDYLRLVVNGYDTSVAAVPLPGGVWLFGTGLVALAAVRRRRKAKKTV